MLRCWTRKTWLLAILCPLYKMCGPLQVKHLVAAAQEAFLGKQRAVKVEIVAAWQELVAARRESVIRAADLRSDAVKRQVISAWRCHIRVCVCSCIQIVIASCVIR